MTSPVRIGDGASLVTSTVRTVFGTTVKANVADAALREAVNRCTSRARWPRFVIGGDANHGRLLDFQVTSAVRRSFTAVKAAAWSARRCCTMSRSTRGISSTRVAAGWSELGDERLRLRGRARARSPPYVQ